MMSETTMREIIEIICETLNADKIDPQESLYDRGVDSMNMLFILNNVENHFNIKIPDDELLISNFETAENICNLVDKLKGAESK